MKPTKLQFPAAIRSVAALGAFATLILLFLNGCKKTMEPAEEALASQEELAAAAKRGGHDKGVDIQLVADGFSSPLGVVDAGDNSKRLFVIDQIGKIWIIDKHGRKLSTPFLDITSKVIPLNPNGDERGLLGLAFHPNYKHNGKFYVYYQTTPRPGGPTPTTFWNNLSRLSEFRVSGHNENIADPSSERAVLELDDPQGNHNGGTIAFGPDDGYLYIAIGDGGGANDVGAGHVPDWYLPNPGGNGQDITSNLFGNILRIDVNGNPYSIPPSNPFVNKPGLDEIYAFGLRNPYRFSIDMEGDHDLILGDVGQLLYEEINVIKKGGNYGWNVKEGFTCFNATAPLSPLPSCPTVDDQGRPLIDPVIVMNNFRNPAGGRTSIAIIGGHVYRGNELHQFRGKYIFGSYTSAPGVIGGELFVAEPRNYGPWSFEEISLESSPDNIGALIKGFGEDRKGEIYVTTSQNFGPVGNTGKIYQLVRADK
jgi:glucose/arabinose dehydrogenase